MFWEAAAMVDLIIKSVFHLWNADVLFHHEHCETPQQTASLTVWAVVGLGFLCETWSFWLIQPVQLLAHCWQVW